MPSFDAFNPAALGSLPKNDYSWLAKLPQAFWQGQEQGREAGLRSALATDEAKAALASGDYGKIASIVSQYDPSLGLKVGLAHGGLDNERFAETKRHNLAMEDKQQGNSSYVTSVPDQYGVNQPASYDRKTQQITPLGTNKRYRPISEAGVEKLTDKGQQYSALRDFTDTFNDSYAGANFLGIDYGNAEKTIGQLGIGTQNASDTAEWWQAYDRNKNVVRKELYGTALTPPEQREFERADIRPGQDPSIVKHNLAIQKTIIERGMKKKADALKAAGYNPAVIDSAYGLDSSKLQNNPIPGPGSDGPSAAAAPPKDRVKGQTYQTPKGPMTWTGTGWVPAQ